MTHARKMHLVDAKTSWADRRPCATVYDKKRVAAFVSAAAADVAATVDAASSFVELKRA